MAKTSINSKSAKPPIFKIILSVVLVASLATNGFLLWQYSELKTELTEANRTVELFKNDPESAQQASVAEYVEQVGLVYDLPEDETPSVATVQDKELLKEQPFFERAENGDVVLIYPEAELAILYRPGSGQLINVSTLDIEEDQPDALDVQTPDNGSSGPGSSAEDTP